MIDFIVGAETFKDLLGGSYVIGDKLVRCKDCKYWEKHGWCLRRAPFDKMFMGAYEYCSKGSERTFK